MTTTTTTWYSIFTFSHDVADCQRDPKRCFVVITLVMTPSIFLFNHYSIQNELFKKVLFPSYIFPFMFPELFFDIYKSRMSSFISRQAVKSGKSLLLQQRRRNSSGSTADNGKFHCWKQYLLNYQSFTFSPTGPFTITIPKIGVAVGSAALAFQITVLDPWCDFLNAHQIEYFLKNQFLSHFIGTMTWQNK